MPSKGIYKIEFVSVFNAVRIFWKNAHKTEILCFQTGSGLVKNWITKQFLTVPKKQLPESTFVAITANVFACICWKGHKEKKSIEPKNILLFC